MKTKTSNFTIAELQRRIDDIDLNPTFQREKVWPKKKQQKFIDTIIKDWGVPKIYLSVKEKGEKGNEYICVDGKQRLTAIFSFLTDGFNLDKDLNNSKISEKKYSELPRKIQDKIHDYNLTIEEIHDAKDEEITELFRRLQLGVSLNSAEKLMSITNEITDFIKSLTRNKFFKNKINISNRRYAFHAVATQICCSEITGAITNLKYKNLEDFIKSYPKFNKSSPSAKAIRRVIEYMNNIFNNNAEELSNRASVISYYILISELIKRGDISKYEKDLSKFFNEFYTNLKKVNNEENISKLSSSEAELLKYQNAVIQSADSKTSIEIRNRILRSRLINYSKDFQKLLGAYTDIDKFKDLYNRLELKNGGSSKKFNEWLGKNVEEIKTISCKKGVETLPIHVRHSINHIDHPKHTKSELLYSIKVLESLES